MARSLYSWAWLGTSIIYLDKQVYHSLNTQQLTLEFCGSLLPRPPRAGLHLQTPKERIGELVSDTFTHICLNEILLSCQ